ncbi:MAG: hypothetical protein DRP15_02640, partial [Candidatus Aenigmatarchaeota archaeon]
GGIKNVTMNVTFPNGTSYEYNMTYISRSGDIYIYELNLTDTDDIGVYSLNATAYDIAGNMNYTTSSFEIFPGVMFSGVSVDEEKIHKPPIVVNFTFYKPGTNETLYNFTSDPATGYYNYTIDARTYDMTVDVWNHSIILYNASVLSDVYNPIVFGEIQHSLIGKGSIGKGLYAVNIINITNATLSMDYSEYLDEISSLNYLAIYHCSDWITYTTCNTTWTRLGGTVNTTEHKIYVMASNISGAYAIAEYLCGNGVCERTYGESAAVCPQDCPPVQPQPPPPAGAGGAGGAAGIGAGAGAAMAPAAGAQVVPVEIKSTLIFVTLRQGEFEIHSIEFSNNQPTPITVKTTVEGNVWELVNIERPEFVVPGRSTGVVKVKLFALPTTPDGIYTGDIITEIVGTNITHRTPITLKVERVPEPLLDVKIKALTKTVEPGGNLTFEVTLINMGETAKIDDIVVTYTIRRLSDEYIIYKNVETVGIEQIKTFKRTITLPNNIPYDRYTIEANVTYWDGRKTAIAVDSFDVIELPPLLVALRNIFWNWVTYVVLFAIVPSIYGANWLRRYFKEKKVKKARYIFPMDFKSLPQPGPDSFPVGKIAETDVVAYMSTTQLLTHGISAGATGSGKSVSAMVIAEELLKRKIPVIVFDPTAQWTGFLRPCRDRRMLRLYPKFGLRPSDIRRFPGRIIRITDPDTTLDVREFMVPGEITIVLIDRLEPAQLDHFVRKTISDIFKIPWPEATNLKLFIIYDEVHRLLPKYGGKGGYVALERGCREFRKWGIGLWLISQVLMDFKGAIRANISNEIQLRTKYTGDIKRVATKYGSQYAATLPKLKTGTGMFQNAEYNHGKPYFIEFRPLLHDTGRLSEKEIEEYIRYDKEIGELEKKVKELKARKINTADIEFELKLAKDKVKQTAFAMARTYLESVKKRIQRAEAGG